ncbi:YgjP-like metallopeptidase domain-containing protein [Azotobacter chroococcum]|uniref:YgjP-like metallopeptidase domain-containing protein n=1 Tax=Azotobacter chroococcum TaxID=353 RepID=UPI0026BB6888
MSVPIVRSEPDAPADRPTLAFHYGGERIAVERSCRSRDVQRVLIKVDPDGRVRVQAPAGASDAEVLQAVKKRGRWIYEQLRTFRAQCAHVTPRQYLSGESHHYLGRRHVLKVIEAPNETQQVRLLRGRLEVSLHRKSPEKVRSAAARLVQGACSRSVRQTPAGNAGTSAMGNRSPTAAHPEHADPMG